MPNGVISARMTDAHRAVYPGERIRMTLLGLLAASGGFVFIEPAPYDVLAILMLLGLLATGLRFPTEIRAHGVHDILADLAVAVGHAGIQQDAH